MQIKKIKKKEIVINDKVCVLAQERRTEKRRKGAQRKLWLHPRF